MSLGMHIQLVRTAEPTTQAAVARTFQKFPKFGSAGSVMRAITPPSSQSETRAHRGRFHWPCATLMRRRRPEYRHESYVVSESAQYCQRIRSSLLPRWKTSESERATGFRTALSALDRLVGRCMAIAQGEAEKSALLDIAEGPESASPPNGNMRSARRSRLQRGFYERSFSARFFLSLPIENVKTREDQATANRERNSAGSRDPDT